MQKKPVLVIGLGISGRSAARFLIKRGVSVVGVDRNPSLLEGDPEIALLKKKGLTVFHESYFPKEPFSLAVLSPGIPFSHPLLKHLLNRGIEVIGEIELAFRFLSRFTTLIGITGTNGKTTVTMLVEHVLNYAGMAAKAVGNIGIPLTEEVGQEENDSKGKILVCELSSYQIETVQSRVIDAAVILNVTPDHLDRYLNLEAYAAAKMRIGECLKAEGTLFVHPRIQAQYGSLLKKYKKNVELFIRETYKESLNHDEENRLAAYALCSRLGVSLEVFDAAERTFRKPPHRIEFVRTFGGVRYFNDSKGTNLDAVMRAVQSMEGQVILIAGGKDKGSSFEAWIEPFQGKVKAIVAIGEAKEKILNALRDSFPVVLKETLESAVECASSLAEEGDNVLLSPGCSSLDMFKHFEERGEIFKKIINKIWV